MADGIEIAINGALPAQTFLVNLSGVSYRMTIIWNGRMNAWTMTLADDAGEPIVAGVKLLAGWAPLRLYQGALLPPGELCVVDSANAEDEQPGRDDFGLGKRFKLVYVETL